jgi:hypothetical protein
MKQKCGLLRASSEVEKMKHITKPINPVNLDSGERRDLQDIIDGLRKGIIVPEDKDRGASPDDGDRKPDRPTLQRDGGFRGRAAAIRMGLLGIGDRIPA